MTVFWVLLAVMWTIILLQMTVIGKFKHDLEDVAALAIKEKERADDMVKTIEQMGESMQKCLNDICTMVNEHSNVINSNSKKIQDISNYISKTYE